MADINIEKADWAAFLEWVTRSLPGARAEVDVLSLEIGAQIEASSLPLLGIAYDRKNDLIEIALEGLDHMVHRPRDLAATEDEIGLLAIQIVDEDDVRQIIKLTRPLELPSPAGMEGVAAWKRDPAKNKVGKSAP